MHPLLNIAIKAARNASKIILRATDRLDTIQIKEKAQNDFVTEIDQLAEQEIIKTIHNSYPDHAILGEESGSSDNINDYTWIIDPIDGTTNFIHGNPNFCISIAIKHKNKVEHGLIYDPLRQELFTATYGAGAFLNERRIRVAQKKNLSGSIIAAGFNIRNIDKLGLYLKILASILPQGAKPRATGSAALDCVYVACGRNDAFWGMKLSPWDIAASTLIVREAGGMVTDFNGKGDYLKTGNTIATNPHLSKILLQLTQERL